MKFLVLGILIINILGAFQSCKKDPQPDPKPQPVFFNVTAINADGGVTLVPSGTGKVEKGTVVTYTINSGPSKKFLIKKNGVAETGYLSGNYTYQTVISADTYIEVVSADVTFTVNATTMV
ncbi:MAG: hypothetical protein IMZ64_08430, partial [Bacteroidetes bacterium]|nr:hypothetical protein [Bacteroidota bacterium]